jgi:hypothetical protein
VGRTVSPPSRRASSISLSSASRRNELNVQFRAAGLTKLLAELHGRSDSDHARRAA